MTRIRRNQQSAAGRAAGPRRLPLRLRDQPRRRHSPTLSDRTIWGSLAVDPERPSRDRRSSSKGAVRVSRIRASTRQVVLLLAQEGGRLVKSLDVAVEDRPKGRSRLARIKQAPAAPLAANQGSLRADRRSGESTMRRLSRFGEYEVSAHARTRDLLSLPHWHQASRLVLS
jgi:hypothetical protein